jgi:hypothetical protein
MKRFKPYFLGMLIGTALTFIALRYHVIRHDDGISLVPRHPQPALRSIYSDVREWGGAMWEQHPEVAQAVIADDKIDVISDEALDQVSEQVRETLRISSEKMQSLLSEHQAERNALAEIEATSVSSHTVSDPDTMTIGRMPQGIMQNAPAPAQVPIVEEPPTGPSQTSPPAPAQWQNPFDFQPRRSGTPAVGSDEADTRASDAVAERAGDPWLRELALGHTEGDIETSIPASFESELNAAGAEEAVENWLPGVLTQLLAEDGQTMHGETGPSAIDFATSAAESDAAAISAADSSIPARSSIPAPEALREPISPARPF